jgi:hypothetical protein
MLGFQILALSELKLHQPSTQTIPTNSLNRDCQFVPDNGLKNWFRQTLSLDRQSLLSSSGNANQQLGSGRIRCVSWRGLQIGMSNTTPPGFLLIIRAIFESRYAWLDVR